MAVGGRWENPVLSGKRYPDTGFRQGLHLTPEYRGRCRKQAFWRSWQLREDEIPDDLWQQIYFHILDEYLPQREMD